MREENFDVGSPRQLTDFGYLQMEDGCVMSEETGLIHKIETFQDLVALVVVSTLRIEDMGTVEMEAVA